MPVSSDLSPQKLGLKEDEKDEEKIKKARQDFVDKNNKMLYSDNVIPLAVWYIRNLDQVDTLEKQMRRKIHYVIKLFDFELAALIVTAQFLFYCFLIIIRQVT
mgnify:CR=1 FL=1